MRIHLRDANWILDQCTFSPVLRNFLMSNFQDVVFQSEEICPGCFFLLWQWHPRNSNGFFKPRNNRTTELPKHFCLLNGKVHNSNESVKMIRIKQEQLFLWFFTEVVLEMVTLQRQLCWTYVLAIRYVIAVLIWPIRNLQNRIIYEVLWGTRRQLNSKIKGTRQRSGVIFRNLLATLDTKVTELYVAFLVCWSDLHHKIWVEVQVPPA